MKRRIVRKVDRHFQGFDELHWPVDVALIVLGGFLIGAALAYQRFDDPVWYRNAWVTVIGVPIFIGIGMAVTRSISHRWLRRSMQFGMLVSLLVHLFLLIAAVEITMHKKPWNQSPRTRDYVRQRKQRAVPDYTSFQLAQQSRKENELEKPVETPTPQPIEPEQPEHRKLDQSPVEPQPQPVTEPEPTARPEIVKRETVAESVPRRSDQASRLSRSQQNQPPSTSRMPESVASTTSSAASPTTPATDVTRKETSTAASRPATEPSPAPRESEVARKDSARDSMLPPSPQSPTTLRRAPSTARFEPSLAMDNQPQPAERTMQSPVLSPRATEVTRRSTPLASQGRTDASAEAAAEVAPRPELRRNAVDDNPTVAQTPEPLPNRQPRETLRELSQAVAAPETLQTSKSETVAEVPIRPMESRIARSSPTSPQRPARDAPSLNSADPRVSEVTAANRSSTTPSETPQPTEALARTPSVARAPSAERADSPAALASTEPGPANNAPASDSATPNPAATGVAKQASPGSGPPASVTAPEAIATSSPASTAVSRAESSERPTPALTAQQPLGRQAPSATPAVTAVAVAESAQPSASPASSRAAIRPTDTSVARQPASTDTVSAPAQQPAEALRSSPQSQVANTVSRRVTSSDVATMMPLERPTERPARSQSSGVPQTSLAVDSPAVRVTSDPAPSVSQPAPIALSKGEAGTAGAGYSPNLDRSSPAGESPSLVASGSSRPMPSQSGPEGPALSPAAPAAIPRAQADRMAPSSAVDLAATQNGPQSRVDVAGPAHSASAATTQLPARAAEGSVTADRGNVEVDLGPQRIVAQLQSGRASGGGQPELNFNEAASPVRPTRGGATQTALNVDTTAQQVTAAAGDGGSRPQAIDAQSTAITSARTNAGGQQPTSGAPSAAVLDGPASEANASDTIGDVALRKAPSLEAAGEAPGMALASASPEGSPSPSLARRASAAAPSSALMPATDVAGLAGGPATSDSAAESRNGEPATAAMPASVSVASPSRPATGSLPAAVADIAPGAEGAPEATTAPTVQDFAAAVSRRSESSDAPAGVPLIGGGAAGPTRVARSARLSDDFVGAPEIEAIAANASSPTGGAASPQVTGVEVSRRDGGISGAMALDAPDQADSAAITATPGSIGLRAGGNAAGEVPQVALSPGGPQRSRTPSASPPLGSIEPDMEVGPQPIGGNPVGSLASALGPSDLSATVGPLSRSGTTPARAVDLNAAPGEGGLAVIPTADVGIDDRRARADAQDVQARIARLPRSETGGRPNVNTAPTVAAEAFRRRAARNDDRSGGDRLGPETEEAIERGLAFLARYQLPDGRWTLQGLDREQPAMQSDAAATGLALLAFQGAGYTHREHRYAAVVRRAIDFLIASQDAEGAIYVAADEESNRFARLYTHAIATLALCEAYGMTQDPALREPAQRALNYIVATQNTELGGWRYAPNFSSDTSVTGWMMMALKSGELAHLEVPQSTYDGIVRWLNRAQASDVEPHLYRYNPDAPDTDAQRHGRRPSPTMTSVGLLMRLYTGWRRDNGDMRQGADYLRRNLPSMGDVNDPILSRRRDTYYWYYATQVMFHMGGDYWREWNGRLHPMLVQTQITTGPMAGSWDPIRPVPDRWAGQAGRLYVTTLNLLSLEVHYRHLPLYEDTAK